MRATIITLVLSLASSLASAQLSGRVGPTTTRASKASTKVCNILNYGGQASATTDNSAAIEAAWADCKSGGQVYVPPGDYGLERWVTLRGGQGVAINLEGIIYRTGSGGGNMFMIERTTDFELYSATSAGAIQGYGYQFHQKGANGPRILRLHDVTDFSVHDIALVDSPAFHFSMDTCANGEVYNMIIRGGNKGGLDGVDVWGTNIWIHDVEVSNRDECVTVKSPAHHILIESVFCNWSGGCAIGSLGGGTNISNIEYNHIYSQNCNQMMMIKSNGGSGTLKDAVFKNFQGHTNAYTLNLNSAWSSIPKAEGNGVQYTNLTFSNWHGTATDGARRPVIRVLCPAAVPCTDIDISGFYVWTDQGSSVKYLCQNAYGSGPCVTPSNSSGSTTMTSYATEATITNTAGGNYSYTTMPGELTAGLGLTTSIDVPAMPTTFYPGLKPTSALLG